ncbi:sulfotransferase 1 family member D1 [Caerostris darwini]|uniref:Sulfotransferase 1 family member D1 n=1 Tax=Caerostris darwini TaxID=1538125 RepID=A0AAV4RSM8_9ARAC|nr:sulfotransferase 1 family member D1 [Caerostris darwini]
MRKNPLEGLLLISKFLGYDLSGKDDLIERILKHSSFEYMKANVTTMEKESVIETGPNAEKNDRVEFFRSGNTGGKNDYLSDSQKEILKNRMEEKLKGSDIEQFWK